MIYITSANVVNIATYFDDLNTKIDPNEIVHSTINAASKTINIAQPIVQKYAQ